MTTFIPSSDLIPYLIFIISPIYRFVNDETIKGKEIGKFVLRFTYVLRLFFFSLVTNFINIK